MARRSLLFTPGDRPDRLRKAPRTGADVVVFDLEDAVPPDRRKNARVAVAELLSDPDFDPDCEVCVRLTAEPDTIERDLEVLLRGETVDTRIDALMLPKTGSPADVRSVSNRLERFDPQYPILALVETAAGVLAAPEIARVPETDALVFGAEDLAASIGATRTEEGTEVLYARERVVLAAAAGGVDAIDTVYTDFEDEAGLRKETSFAAQLGYDGKLAIHPAQIEPIHETFTPTDKEREWAREVLDAAAASADGVFELDGQMIDAPLITQAERILERANADP